jgi:RNA polymerase sigma-70 factor (ECF subfamily)
MRADRTLRLVPAEIASRETGAAGAYEDLLDRHWAALVRYAAAIVRSGDAAQDIAQEAFVRLWASRAHAGSPQNAEREVAYLYRTVRNLSLNERRWRRVRALWLERQPADGAQAPAVEDEEAVDARVRRAVAELPRRRREVFELARYHDLTYQQIAVALGLSAQTVANHMSAALRDLRSALHDLL